MNFSLNGKRKVHHLDQGRETTTGYQGLFQMESGISTPPHLYIGSSIRFVSPSCVGASCTRVTDSVTCETLHGNTVSYENSLS